jgi:uncharacterized repeat protein (TIGR01451 family)
MRSFPLSVLLLLGGALLAFAQSADLGVFKSGPDTAAAGANVTYTITASNGGPDPSGGVTIVDPIPAGMTFVSLAVAPGFSCSTPPVGSGGTVSCSIITFAAGPPATFTLVVKIPPGAPPGTVFTNIVSIFSDGTPDPNSENDSAAQATIVPAPTADVSVTKTAPVSAVPNSNITYSITVANGGPNAATTVQLTDVLPPPLTFVSLTQSPPAVFACTTPVIGANGAVTCTRASFAAGSPETFTLVAHIPSGTAADTVFINAASVTSDFDFTPENDVSIASTTVSSADLSITKSGPPGKAQPGSTITYTITVANSGPDAASDVAWIDALPAGTTFASLTQNTGPGFTCSTPPVDSGGTVSCALPTMNSGESAQFSLAAKVTASPGTTITNTATVTSTSGDANPANNSATFAMPVSSADVTIAKTGPAGAVTVGTTITYAITVTNNGPDAAQTVAWSDVLPPNTTFASLNQSTGPVFTCSTPAAGSAGTINCTLATMNASASAQFTLVVNVTGGVGSTVTNTATVTSSSDPNSSNNTASAGVPVTSPDLSVTKTGPAGAVMVGTTITYTITVTNGGTTDALTVAMNDVLPPNTTFASLNQNTGPVFTCSTPAVGSAGTVNCTLATMSAAASAQFTLVLNVTGGVGTTITNTATVSSPSDTNLANNSSSFGVTIASPDLSITKSGPTSSVPVGSPITYTITVTNNSASAALTVAWSDVLPANTTFAALSQDTGPAFTCTTPAVGAAGTVNCTLASMSGSAVAQFRLVVGVTGGVGTTITNTATVSSPSDTNPANNTASFGVQVVTPRAVGVPAVSPLALGVLFLAIAIAAAAALRKQPGRSART